MAKVRSGGEMINKGDKMSKNNDEISYTYGVISVLCSIVGLFVFGFILNVFAIIMSSIGLKKENEFRPLCIVGLILSIVSLLFLVIFFRF